MDLKAAVDGRIRRFGSTKRDRAPGIIGGLRPMTDGESVLPVNADMMMNPEQQKLSMANPEIRTPSYWYKQHEVENVRSKRVPNTTVMNAMMYKNFKNQNVPYLTKEQIQLQDRADQMALQLKAEFIRPKAVVFDSQGKFHRTRVDEQSYL